MMYTNVYTIAVLLQASRYFRYSLAKKDLDKTRFDLFW